MSVDAHLRAAEIAVARREAGEISEKARSEASSLRREATAAAQEARERAQAVAAGIEKEARARAEELVAGAQEAADEALREARAVSGGLRRLGESLNQQAERMLTDVQAAHRQISSDLRVASGGRAASGARGASAEPLPWERRRDTEAREGEAGEPPPRRAERDRGADSPAFDIDVPSWTGRP